MAHSGRAQMSLLPDNMQMVTMQAGGNDAGFFNVASNCIFHQDQGKDYGEEYPMLGACLDAIKASEAYIKKDRSLPGGGTYSDTLATIKDVLASKEKKFDLYVLGYAHFFNVPGGDWCNEATFSVNAAELAGGIPPKLTAALRNKINDLTTGVNSEIKAAVDSLKNPKVHYVSITEGFDHRRFCEPGSSSYENRYGSDNVWIWNVSPRDVFWHEDKTAAVTNGVIGSLGAVGTTLSGTQLGSGDKDKQKEADKAWNAAYNTKNPSKASLEYFNWDDLLNFDKSANELTSPSQGGGPGWQLRPFHPMQFGHQAIKDAIKKAIS